METGFDSKNLLSKVRSYLELANAKSVVLSPSFFRKLECPSGCGSCCHKIVLEYFEDSIRWQQLKKMYPGVGSLFKLEIVDGVRIWRWNQKEHRSKFCFFLDLNSGRCGIHEVAPFPCKFAPCKFLDRTKSTDRSILLTTYYGRAWSFTKIDKSRGADCIISEDLFTEETYLQYIEYLSELNNYANLLKIDTKLPKILEYLLSEFPNIPTVPINF